MHNKQITTRTILPVMALVATTAACTPVKDDYPEYRNDDRYYTEEAIERCQDAIANKVERQQGYRSDVQFGQAQVYQRSRTTDTVEGKGTLRQNRRYTHFDYQCDINVRNNRVVSAEIDYQENNIANNQHTKLCKQAVRERVHRDIDRKARLTFHDSQSQPVSSRRTRISGEFDVRQNGRSGSMHYNCTVDTRRDRIDSLDTRWIDPLSSNDVDYAKQCHKAVSKKLKNNGAKKTKIESTNRQRSKNRLTLTGDGSFRKGKKWENIEYICRFNTRNDKLESVNYRFKSKDNYSGTPMRGDKHIEGLCKKALVYQTHKQLGQAEHGSFFGKVKSANVINTRDGARVEGEVLLRPKGIPLPYAYSCSYNRAEDKIDSVTIDLP